MEDQVTTIIHTPTGDVDASKVELPASERRFRDAWRLEGEVIVVDMEAAREIAREQIRREREPIFHALDVQYQRTTETGSTEGLTDIVSRKQALRDAPQDPRIDEAQNDVELTMAVDDILNVVRSV